MVDIAKGKFERTNAENYDEFLKALDVNFLLRKAATASTPTMEVRNLHKWIKQPIISFCQTKESS